MSNEVYESINGKIYEVSGVPPDYKIEYPREENELLKSMNIELKTKDRAIEKVIELMK
jgi:carboxyl-terminal processing protease